MPVSMAAVTTPQAASLIKWLAVAAAVDLADDGRAVIAFPQGTCVLIPAGEGLTVITAAADRAALAAVQEAIAGQLRSAGRDEPGLTWTAPVSADAMEITDPVIDDYVLRHSTPPDSVLGDLIVKTREVTGGAAGMQVSPDEGVLLTMLTRMVNARYAVEVGVFTGYSSICIARGLAEGGRLLACDISEEWTAIARDYWRRAGVADRIDLRIGPAIDTLRALPAEPRIDLAFIDADKISYPLYYEEVLRRLRPGGLVALDNVLLGGRVVDPAYQQDHHQAMRRLNDLIADDQRVETVMLPVRDGLTLVRRR